MKECFEEVNVTPARIPMDIVLHQPSAFEHQAGSGNCYAWLDQLILMLKKLLEYVYGEVNVTPSNISTEGLDVNFAQPNAFEKQCVS